MVGINNYSVARYAWVLASRSHDRQSVNLGKDVRKISRFKTLIHNFYSRVCVCVCVFVCAGVCMCLRVGVYRRVKLGYLSVWTPVLEKGFTGRN